MGGKDSQYYLHDAPESTLETLDAECLFDMDKENNDILRFDEDDTQGHECGHTNSAFIKYGKDSQYYLHDAPESTLETLDAECLFDMDKENNDILRFDEDDTQGHE